MLGDAMNEMGAEADNPINILLTDPSCKQIRDDIRANPERARELLDTLKQSNPELYDMIPNDPEFLDEIVDAIHDGSEQGDSIQLNFDGMDAEQGSRVLNCSSRDTERPSRRSAANEPSEPLRELNKRSAGGRKHRWPATRRLERACDVCPGRN
jgi:XPC-binding domain